MEFVKIDKQNWKRKPYFEHYHSEVPCTYSISVKLDISELVNTGKKLYPTMLYCISTVVNRYEEFRTAFNSDGELGIYSSMSPCYTVFHKETHTFSNMWTEYCVDYVSFCKAYTDDLSAYGKIEAIDAKPETPANIFNVSMIPWLSFEGFNLNLQKGYDYLLPIFTMGKYYKEGDKTYLPLAIQVHHAVCDGFHVGRFVNDLQNLISNL